MQFMSSHLLVDFHESENLLYGHCNTGTTSTNLKGGYGSINYWLSKEGISNIVSIPVPMKLSFRITFISNNNHWCVSKDNITAEFKEDK